MPSSEGLLAGVRVLEVSSSIAVSYCGWLFADAGASVTRIERTVGYPRRPASFAAFLDAPKAPGDARLLDAHSLGALSADFDIIVFDEACPELVQWFSREENYASSGLVGCGLSASGMQGAGEAAENDPLVLCALSGFASVTPEDPADREAERPMQLWGNQTEILTGINALVACLQARIHATATGRGAFIDCSALNVLSAHATPALAPAWVDEPPPLPPSQRPQSVPRGMLKCRDGYVYTQGGDDNWDAWADLVGRPEWKVAPFDDPSYRATEPTTSVIREQVAGWLQSHSADEVFRACQAADIVTFPVHTIDQLLKDAQAEFRKSLVRVTVPEYGELRVPRSPINGVPGPETPRWESARRIGGKLPLEGVRVADFSWVIAGPRCTSWLGAMGADIIKVEGVKRPDRTRGSSPFIGATPSLSSSISFNMLNHSKRALSLDLSTGEGRRLAHELVRNCDVAIENYSGPAAQKLGLSYGQLAAVNPGIIMVSCSGMGRTGPDSDLKAFGKSIHSYSGSTWLNSWPGTPPRGTGSTWTDPLVGAVATAAILEALIARERTGKGAYFDMSMAETTTAALADAFFPAEDGQRAGPVGNAHPWQAVHDTFRCSDGLWLAVVEPAGLDRAEAGRALGLPDDGNLASAVRELCRARTATRAARDLCAAGLKAVPVRPYTELYDRADPHGALRWRRATLPGVGDFPMLELPWVQHPDPGYRYTVAPEIGADTDEILSSILGLSEEQIHEAKESGATL